MRDILKNINFAAVIVMAVFYFLLGCDAQKSQLKGGFGVLNV